MKNARRYTGLCALLICCALVLLNTLQPAQAAAPAQQTSLWPTLDLAAATTIRITDAGFAPATLAVFGPTEITWINETATTHTLRSGEPGANPTGQALYLPLIQRGSRAAVEAATVYLDYLYQTALADDFAATLAPGQSFTYHVTTLGKTKFYLTAVPTLQGEINLSGVGLIRTSPSNGEGAVAVTRETILEFSAALDPATATAAAFVARAGSTPLDYRLNLSADRQRVTLFYKTALPGSTRVRVTVDGSLLKDAQGNQVDIDGDGTAGGTNTIEFDTLSLTVLPGTKVCGRVFASELAVSASNVSVNTPLKDVTVSVDGLELQTKTDANGNFCLDPAPVGRFFVHVAGQTATNNIPAGQYYPTVGKAWQSIAGKESNVGDVFLPLIPANTLQAVSASQDTQITFPDAVLQRNPDLRGVSILVPANSLFNDDGERGGKVGIAPVPPDRLPGTLPAGLNFPVVITVQTDGAMNFDRPAPVCFPNLPDATTGQALAAGEKSALWSFDHDTGDWAIVGPMTVSANGKMVCADAGVGIRAPGWHGSQPGTSGSGPWPLPTSPLPVPVPEPLPDSCPDVASPSISDIAGAGSKCATKLLSLRPLVGLILKNAGVLAKLYSDLQKIEDDYRSGLEPDRAALLKRVATIRATSNAIKIGIDELSGIATSKLKGVIECLNSAAALLDSTCKTIDSVPNQCLNFFEKNFLIAYCDATHPALRAYLTAVETFLAQVTSTKTQLVFEAIDRLAGIIIQHMTSPNITMNMQSQGRVTDIDPMLLKMFEDWRKEAESFSTIDINKVQQANSVFESVSNLSILFGRAYLLNKGVLPKVYLSVQYNDSVIRSISSASGTYQFLLPGDTPYQLSLFDPSTTLCGTIASVSASNGEFTQFHNPFMTRCDSEDMDIDELSDEAESIIGTNSNLADTDNDGIPDGTEIQNGSDPLDGLPAQTGTLSTAETPGMAVDVCVHNDLAVVADSDKGVAVFNVFDVRNPTLIAQVDTPGKAQRVACGEGRVAVADGDQGLALLDIRNVANATVIAQLDLGNTTAVALAGGTVYAGTQGGRVVAVDLASGAIRQESTLASRINDLALVGDLLYVLTDNNTLHTLDPRFELQPLHSVTAPTTLGNNQRLFAGTDLLYTTHGRGYNTFRLNNPAAPEVIAPGSTNQFGWRQIVSNGSKAGLAVVGANSNTPRDLALYDLSDPSQTDQFQTQFTTPGDAQAVALYKGLAYVADGAAGLQIINYLSYDSLGVAPTVLTATPFNGGKAEENALTRVTARVNDDLQARQVEFYIDGRLAATDGSYPFEYRFVTPRINAQPSFKLRVRALDTGGNAAWSNEETLTLVPDATAPLLLSYAPAKATNPADSVQEVSVTFSEAINQSTLHGENFQLLSAGADNRPGTADDTTLSGGTIAYDASANRATLRFNAPLPAGLYRAKLGSAVADLAGNRLIADFTWDFGVGQRIPIGGVIAGEISNAGEQDVYTFVATAKQWIYFDDQNASRPGYFYARLQDSSGQRIFEDTLDGADPSGYSLELGGEYTLTIWGYRETIGAYQFQLRSNPPDLFTIQIGAVVKNGQPGVGAGNIELPGNGNRYVFTATANQWVYFDDQDSSRSGYFGWEVYDPSGKRIFLDYLNGDDPGAHQLPLAGEYTIYTWAYANVAGTYQFQLRSNPPDTFAINIGDVVKDGQPGAGAGNIELPGNTNKYTFNATANQWVYFDDQNSSRAGYFAWDVYDPSGKRVFLDYFNGDDPGAHKLILAGEYTIYTWAYANIAGTYQFQLRSNPPDVFGINIGDVVKDAQPGSGAGNIELPGNTNRYTFRATANQVVYFDDQNSSRPSYFAWEVYDSSGKRVFLDYLNGDDPGAHQLTLGGEYTIYTWAYANIAGTYQFQLRSNPPDVFAINIGDVVRDGQPGVGAGNIEVPGNANKYTFMATANQRVYFDDQNSSRSGYFAWDLYDPTGTHLFRDYLNDNDPGVYQLKAAGEYTIWTWAYADVAGTYQFQFRSNPPDTFTINIGDTVQNGIPGPGAGQIELPGNYDVYRFTAIAGQQVYFDDQNAARPGYFYWRVVDAGNTQILGDWLNGTDPGALTLTRGGEYTIYVSAETNVAGTYQFQIRNPTITEIATTADVTIIDEITGVEHDFTIPPLSPDRTSETEQEENIYLPHIEQ